MAANAGMSKEASKQYGTEASMTPDRERPTSPVRDGGSDAGGAPMSGTTEFTHARTRVKDQGTTLKRSLGV
jgi:general stress protein YciG